MQQRSVEPNNSWLRAKAARSRLEGLASRLALPGIVLTSPGAVAWATGGAGPLVDRSAATDLVWVVLAAHGAALVTTEVERDRITEEYRPGAHDFELLAVPWYEPDAFVEAAADFAGAGRERLAADGHPGFGADVAEELVSCRLALSEPERAALRALGADAAGALGEALRAFRPGRSRDLDVQGDVARALESAGAEAPVLIVGGDERVRRYRHPLACGAVVDEIVMAVVVARRAGLHVAATRFCSRGPLSASDRELRRRVLQVDRAVLEACTPGRPYGEVLERLAAAYEEVGAPGAWREHYQGGPIGFAQREFEIAPGRGHSRWAETPVALGHALAWNPSLAGGAKVEDTYLLGEDGLEAVTVEEGWPTEPPGGRLPARPAVIELA